MFYVDSCIYLNLWQKEVGKDGVEFWKIAEDFFDKTERDNVLILFSGFVLKELQFILDAAEYRNKRALFDDSFRFKRVFPDSADYAEARKLESASGFDISFFDCMHIVLSKRENVILVTRDNKLICFAQKYCAVSRPEELH